MKILDDFIKYEEAKMNWFDKICRNFPVIKPTNAIGYSYKNFTTDTEKIFKPSIWDKFIALVILLFLSIVWLGLLQVIFEFKFPFPVFLFGFILVTFLIYILFRNSFFNPKYIYTLTINQVGIAIDSKLIYWNEVAETYIMNRQEGRITNYYLIILKKNKTLEKLNLFRIATTDKNLATAIEYYKNQNKLKGY